MEKVYRTEFLKQGCIGCRACAKILPSIWGMEDEDPKTENSKAFLKDSKQIKTSEGIVIKEIREFGKKDKESQIIGISICPVNVIKCYEIKTGKLLEKL